MNQKNNRYYKHLILDELGVPGQDKLSGSTVLIVGAGALGSIQSQLLARAGVGSIRLVDSDWLEPGNLQRQLLYDEQDLKIGQPKVRLAVKKLSQINSTIDIKGYVERATAQNIFSLMQGADLVMDASDNFHTRYMLNDACIHMGIPWIYGGVTQTMGMTMPILPQQGPCMRCVFPEPPDDSSASHPDDVGIFSPAPVTIGALQTSLALRVLVGQPIEPPLLLVFDVWREHVQQVPVTRDGSCPACGRGQFEYL